jgi:hypothetical protein
VTLMVSLSSFSASGCAQRSIPRWEIEFHGGGEFSNLPSGGSGGSLPAPGPSFTTTVGTTSRRNSSWYFGDGATLLNQVVAALGATRNIAPLDPVLTSRVVEARNGPSFGFRASGAITPRFSAEFTFDYSLASFQLTRAALDGIEASRASFEPAWNALIATGPFMRPAVTSVTEIEEGDAKQLFSTGTLNINLKTTGSVIPYAAVGAGLVHNVGSMPGASLRGNYQFQPFGVFTVNETDLVALRSSIDEGFVAVFGGGLKYFVSRRWGVRFDARAYVGSGDTVTLMDASPRPSALTVPSGVTASFTTPSVQFSNNGNLGPSSLAAPQIRDFETFVSRGRQTRLHVTAGVFVGF